MGYPEKRLINSLIQSLHGRQRIINSQLKETQRYEQKLIKRFQRGQRQRDNEPMDEVNVQLTQHKEEMDKLIGIKAQLRERLKIVEFKLAEINRKQII